MPRQEFPGGAFTLAHRQVPRQLYRQIMRSPKLLLPQGSVPDTGKEWAEENLPAAHFEQRLQAIQDSTTVGIAGLLDTGRDEGVESSMPSDITNSQGLIASPEP